MLFDSTGSAAGRRRGIPTVGMTSRPVIKKPPAIGTAPGSTRAHGRPFRSQATGGNAGSIFTQPGMEGSAMGLQGGLAQVLGGGGGMPNMSTIKRMGYGGGIFTGGGVSAGGY